MPVEKRRILVVDDSPAMRETLCVLLGSAFAVEALSCTELRRAAAPPRADLVIASTALRGSGELAAAPVLWLGDADLGLSRRFTPTDLRRRVADRLREASPAAPGDTVPQQRPADWRLREPFLDASSRSVIERARATGLALHIAGEPGSGKHALARALHGGGDFLVCDAAHPVPPETRGGVAPRRPTVATLLAIGVDRWSEDAQRALSDRLAASPAGLWRIVSTATHSIAELLDDGLFLPDLYYLLTLLSVELRPLRERPTQIAAIATALAADIAAELGKPAPTLGDAAMRRLSNYLWFGNIAELQAVLTRSIALAPRPHLEAEDLRFDGGLPSGPPSAAAQTAAERPDLSDDSAPGDAANGDRDDPAPESSALIGSAADRSRGDFVETLANAGEAGVEEVIAAGNGAAFAPPPGEPLDTSIDSSSNLDMIIHELAHEFKNPLVAIKSFTQHCQRSLPAGEPDEIRFAEVTERAAEQMDQVLENLLTFTRMTEPQPQVIALDRLLAPLFANGGGVGVDYIAPPPVLVRVDPEQVSYAIDNLLRALLRDAPPGRQMIAQFCAPDALLCQLPAGPASARDKLRELVGEDDAAQAEAMPLGIALASALLERNGAELRMTREGDPKTVMIRFPLVENEVEEEVRNGTSPRVGG